MVITSLTVSTKILQMFSFNAWISRDKIEKARCSWTDQLGDQMAGDELIEIWETFYVNYHVTSNQMKAR